MTLCIPRWALAPAAIAFFLVSCGPVSSITGADSLVQPRAVEPAALKAAANEPAVKAFYESRSWRPAWTPANARQLELAFETAWTHGMNPQAFKDLVTADDPQTRELQLTQAALAYAGALAHGLADPKAVYGIYAIKVNDPDLPAGLAGSLKDGKLDTWLATLAPQDREYRALSDAYLRYRNKAMDPQPEAIGQGAVIHPGDRDPRIPALMRRLRADGYLSNGMDAPSGSSEPGRYTDIMVEAVKRFQAEQGLEVDGVVGPETVEVLDAGPEDRARQLALNLEERRWLPRDPAPERIDVNLPGAFLIWYRDGRPTERRKVIIGKLGHETPHLAAPFNDLVVNPPWNVPANIAEEEIFPKGPGYMRSRNMYVEDGRVVQRPGPEAALGAVKFDMDDRYAIYLHDTPSKSLFDQSRRYLSHGCVRVQDAVGLARSIAEAHGKGAAFDEGLATGETHVIGLDAEIPVRLLYHTAYVDNDGAIAFRPDVYGWDAQLATALGMPAPVARKVNNPDAFSLGP